MSNRIDDLIRKELEHTGFTYGYIGNVWQNGLDDRSWRIFAPVNGRVRMERDTIGDYSTESRGKLLEVAKAIRKAYDTGRLIGLATGEKLAKPSAQVEQLIYNEMVELVDLINLGSGNVWRVNPEADLEELKAEHPEIWRRVNEAFFQKLYDV